MNHSADECFNHSLINHSQIPTFFNPFNTKRREQIREFQKQIEDCQRILDDEESNDRQTCPALNGKADDHECNIAYDALIDLMDMVERPEFWALEL
jgi:hypothetical protein